MSVVLEGPVRAGDAIVAALVRVRAASLGRLTAFHASKEPVAVLILRGGAVQAFDMAGRPMDEAGIERLCPGGLARLRGWA